VKTICPNWIALTNPTSWMPTRTASTSLVTRLRIRPSFIRWKKLIGWRCVFSKISERSPLTTVSPISSA
jgi:hypothetical protein